MALKKRKEKLQEQRIVFWQDVSTQVYLCWSWPFQIWVALKRAGVLLLSSLSCLGMLSTCLQYLCLVVFRPCGLVVGLCSLLYFSAWSLQSSCFVFSSFSFEGDKSISFWLASLTSSLMYWIRLSLRFCLFYEVIVSVK